MGSRHVVLIFVIVAGYPRKRPYSTYISSLLNMVCEKHPNRITYTYLQTIIAKFQFLHRPAPQHFRFNFLYNDRFRDFHYHEITYITFRYSTNLQSTKQKNI